MKACENVEDPDGVDNADAGANAKLESLETQKSVPKTEEKNSEQYPEARVRGPGMMCQCWNYFSPAFFRRPNLSCF